VTDVRRAALSPWYAVLWARPVVNFVLLPLLGALHGYLTNNVAVWLLFEPIEPVRVPLTRWTVQGILPRRQADLARQVGVAVEEELLGWQDLVTHLATPAFLAQMAGRVQGVVQSRVREMVPAFLPGAFRDRVGRLAGDAAAREALPFLEDLLAHAGELAQTHAPVARLVEERVGAFSPRELETLIRRAAREELAAIVRLGFFMGLAIGLLQGVFLECIGQ